MPIVPTSPSFVDMESFGKFFFSFDEAYDFGLGFMDSTVDFTRIYLHWWGFAYELVARGEDVDFGGDLFEDNSYVSRAVGLRLLRTGIFVGDD